LIQIIASFFSVFNISQGSVVFGTVLHRKCALHGDAVVWCCNRLRCYCGFYSNWCGSNVCRKKSTNIWSSITDSCGCITKAWRPSQCLWTSLSWWEPR